MALLRSAVSLFNAEHRDWRGVNSTVSSLCRLSPAVWKGGVGDSAADSLKYILILEVRYGGGVFATLVVHHCALSLIFF